MLFRLKFWLRFQRFLWCHGCCLTCKHFDVCSETFFAEIDQLPWKM